MKLILAIIEDELAFEVAKALSEKGVRSTKLSSSGGFLKKGNTTLLIGIEKARIEETVEEIRRVCQGAQRDPDSDNEFLANIFILPITDYIQI